MKEKETCGDENPCGGRREFIVKATAIAGGLMLGLSGLASAQKIDEKRDGKMIPKIAADASDDNELVLKLDAASPLGKVGGSQTFDTKAGKVIVVRTGADEFKAFAAVCPHKGGPIKYDEKSSQLFCPWHNSRFDQTGAVVKGPSKTGLPAYSTGEAVVVTLTPKN